MIYRLHLDPIPCPRPRIAIKGKKEKKFAQAYYPAEYQEWKNAAVTQLTQMTKPERYPLVRLSVHFEREQPKKTILATPPGDIDNYCKSLMDALTQADWWDDDKQVVYLQASKSWAPKGDPGLIRFTITQEV